MARWGVKADKGAANVQSVVVLLAATASMRRARIYDWALGCGAAPADNTFIHIAQRCTIGSLAGAAKTPNALDQADTLASTIVVDDTVTTDPTLTAGTFLMWIPLNQRATFRWVAAPYGEWVIPATASTGIMLGLSAVSTTTFDYGVNFEEL
jgi:hypothetical protein